MDFMVPPLHRRDPQELVTEGEGKKGVQSSKKKEEGERGSTVQESHQSKKASAPPYFSPLNPLLGKVDKKKR